MPNTYNAVLKGTQLEWIDDAPLKSDRPLKVHVTILDQSPNLDFSHGKKMAEILEKISISNALPDLDPTAWQREMRSDR